MTALLFLDYETYSCTDLKKSNMYRYVEDPTFEILMCAWSLNGGPVQLAEGEAEIRQIPGLFDSNVKKVAHNAPFERIVTSALAGGKYLPPEDFIDTMILAASNGLPKSLGELARAVGAEDKDTAGTRLINLFCKPNRGKRILPGDRPGEWEDFKNYCIQDVATLIDVWNRIPHQLTPMEQRVWLADQKVNDRGVAVDIPLAEAAVRAAEENTQRDRAEVIQITGVENPNSRDQLLRWFEHAGSPLPDLTKDTVETALTEATDPDVRRVLELRQDLALVASKKYIAALNGTCADGRLRGMFRYLGAHTGRWSGGGVQLHNLPRAGVSDVDTAVLDLLMGNGADPETLKGLVRSMFLGPLSVVDYSAIEARVIAWLAGEQWVLNAFEAGRDIYVETAKRLGPDYDRSDGKVATLALGFQGAVNSLRVMGATGTDEELSVMVWKWRDANPRIVAFWRKMEEAFMKGGTAGRIRVLVDGDIRRVVLPSGRSLVYRGVRIEPGMRGPRASFQDPRGYRTETYGGRLSENVTQATARDIVAEAIVRLEDNGYPVVLHVHDEVAVESTELKEVERLMVEQPSWAKGLPIAAEGFVTERYRKG